MLLGEILADGISCIAVPSLQFYEKDVLQQIALHADDYTGETLGRDGNVRRSLAGFVADIHGRELRVVNWIKPTTVEECVEALIETGWLQPVDEPCADGAYLININRVKRMLDVEETKEKFDLCNANDMDLTAEQQRNLGVFNYDNPLVDGFIEMADCFHDGDFETQLVVDLTDQIDRLLPTVVDEEHNFPPERWTNAIDDWELCVCEKKVPASWTVKQDEAL